MKKILWIILVAGTFTACKKSKVTTPALNNSLFGTWELHSRIGGNIMPPDTTYKPGNGNMLQFNADSTYKSYTNGTLAYSGVFHIVRVADNSAKMMPDYAIYFDSDTSFKSMIAIGNGQLILRPLIPDIGTTEYNKIAN